jgi:hypothetical protein
MMMRTPPSREAWLIDSELHGHTTEQVIRYLSDCDDAAEQAQRRHPWPVGVITFDAEPRWVSRLRSWFGR